MASAPGLSRLLIFLLLFRSALYCCCATAVHGFCEGEGLTEVDGLAIELPSTMVLAERAGRDQPKVMLASSSSSGCLTCSSSEAAMPTLSTEFSAGVLPSNDSVKEEEAARGTPSACPASCFRANPVCGVDGVTYWCGSADAECAGVEVEYPGFCDFGSKGSTGGKGVLAVQSLLLVHMIWLVLAAFLVLLGVP